MPSLFRNVALFAAVVSAAVPAPYPTSSASVSASTSTSRVRDSAADPSKASAAWSVVNKSKSSSTSKSTSNSKSSSVSKSRSSSHTAAPASSQATTVTSSVTSQVATITSSVPNGCPAVPVTTTRSYTADAPYDTKFIIPVTTVTLSQDTYTRTFTTFSATSTVSSSGVAPSTSTYYPTISHTSFLPSTTSTFSICTSTSTTSILYTTTVYTGTYSPSPVAIACSTITEDDVFYPGGTITSTATSSYYPNPTFLTSYAEGGTTTVTAFDSTITETSTVTLEFYVTSGIASSSYSTDCTSTKFFGQANATTTTQAAKCAPTNLVQNVAYIQHFNDQQSFGDYSQTDDASQCCQACAKNELCAAAYWRPGGRCETRVASQGASCGDAMVVEFGTEGNDLTVAPGCGRIVEFGGYN